MRETLIFALLFIGLSGMAQTLELSIRESEPYWVHDTISVDITLRNNTEDTITFFDSRGSSWDCFQEKWELSADKVFQEILPMNGQYDSKFSDSLFISLYPNKDTLIRSMQIPIMREGRHSLTYTQKQSSQIIKKEHADTTVTDSIINLVNMFEISDNVKYIAYTYYDTTITELVGMSWDEWKDYRTVKVYSRSNFFDNIYAALKHPTDVYALNMYCNKLTAFEITRLGRLKNLKSLTLNNYELDYFPKELADLDLYELTIYPKEEKAIDFSQGISTNNTLREFKIKSYGGVPKQVIDLTNLLLLDVSDCPVKVLPRLDSLKNLEELKADNSELVSISNIGLDKLQHLKKLNVSGNKAIDNIYPVLDCANLEFLVMNRTSIDSIPDAIEKLSKLKKLSVSNNLVYISDSIYKLEDMRYLSFGGNKQLTEIPLGVVNMQKLLHFDVSRTQIFELPEGISGLPLEKVMIYNTNCKMNMDYRKLKLKLGDEFKD